MTEAQLALIDNPPDIALSAVIDGTSAGYLTAARMMDGSWYLQNVEVALGHRRRGVASALLAEMFKRIGKAVCMLSVEADNHGAIELYKRQGFRFTSGGRTGPRMMMRVPDA